MSAARTSLTPHQQQQQQASNFLPASSSGTPLRPAGSPASPFVGGVATNSPHRVTTAGVSGVSARAPVRRAGVGLGGSSGVADGSTSGSDSTTNSTPLLLPLPESAMSCHALLSLHLDDYVALVTQLFESFDPAVSGASAHAAVSVASPSSSVGAAAAITAAQAHVSTDAVMARIVRKDQLLQEAVARLLRHQELEKALRAKWLEASRLDAQLVDFCSRLGQLEQNLLDASSDPPGLVRGLGGAHVERQRFRARDVTVFAERLARMSFAPADHLERKAVLHESVTRPPAPLEKLMAGSLLHLTPDELSAVLDSEAAAARDAEEARREALAAGGAVDHAADHLTHVPGSLHALGRADASAGGAAPAALPSFAELAQGGGAAPTGVAVAAGNAPTGTAPPPPTMWRQESAHRAMPAAAPVALDLDLESSDSDDDDDD